MIRFLLNDKEHNTALPAGMLVLDYIRYQQYLTGTKIGCREGDCGACTVLIGELKNDEVEYRSYTSCLTPLGNVHGKHVVTIEGINNKELSPVQSAMADCSATQCGFCTPGFVMSLTGFCLGKKEATQQNAIASIDGNICRCTGYKSIERAAERITSLLAKRDKEVPLSFAIQHQMVPPYFATIKARLTALSQELEVDLLPATNPVSFVGGGTDLYVQKHEEMKYAGIRFVSSEAGLKSIVQQGNQCIIGGAVTVTDLVESPLIRRYFPRIDQMVKLVSSTPIRNMATIAGNLVNASPIGDFTVFFLALNAVITLSNGNIERQLPLRHFYKGYKLLNKASDEVIMTITFELPSCQTRFNFEKVSKRMHLDIASVNTALQLTVNAGVIQVAALSAGGVSPVPALLTEASAYLSGKNISEELVKETISIAQAEISPISDVRGTATYKRLLFSQLIKAHFISLFPELQVQTLMTI